jgi:hypothetical protein
MSNKRINHSGFLSFPKTTILPIPINNIYKTALWIYDLVYEVNRHSNNIYSKSHFDDIFRDGIDLFPELDSENNEKIIEFKGLIQSCVWITCEYGKMVDIRYDGVGYEVFIPKETPLRFGYPSSLFKLEEDIIIAKTN